MLFICVQIILWFMTGDLKYENSTKSEL